MIGSCNGVIAIPVKTWRKKNQVILNSTITRVYWAVLTVYPNVNGAKQSSELK